MKLLSILAIFLAALSVEANSYQCQPLSKQEKLILRLSMEQKQASFFNGRYWSVLEQVAFKLNRNEPVYKFEGTDTFKDGQLILIFNEFQGTAELFDQSVLADPVSSEQQQSLKFQCVF
jgi:hypothetical protein